MRACLTAEARLRQHTGARLHTSTARLGTRGPRAELASHTIHCATVRVARTGLRTVRTCLATDHGLHQRATTTLRPSATRLGACAPAAPRTDSAVHRARVFVTRARFGTVRTRSTAEARGRVHTCTLLRPTATGLGTCRPLRPFFHTAVGRARVHVACARFRCVWARRAAEFRRSAPARAPLHATIARLGARSPMRPSRDSAVFGTWLLIAIASFFKKRARVAAILRMC